MIVAQDTLEHPKPTAVKHHSPMSPLQEENHSTVLMNEQSHSGAEEQHNSSELMSHPTTKLTESPTTTLLMMIKEEDFKSPFDLEEDEVVLNMQDDPTISHQNNSEDDDDDDDDDHDEDEEVHSQTTKVPESKELDATASPTLVSNKDDNPIVSSNQEEDPSTAASKDPSAKPKKALPTSKFNSKGERLYCLCREPDTGTAMVQCDDCKDWFHLACVGLSERSARKLDTFSCPNCVGSNKTTADLVKDAESSASTASSSSSQQKGVGGTDMPTQRRKGSAQHSLTRPPPPKDLVTPVEAFRSKIRQSLLQTFTSISISPEGSGTGVIFEPEKYARDVESEIFTMTHGDIGPTYKAKLRSLQFNLRDPSNAYLRRRILQDTNPLTASQLVHLSSEELNENTKSQAQQIRKSSLASVFKPQSIAAQERAPRAPSPERSSLSSAVPLMTSDFIGISSSQPLKRKADDQIDGPHVSKAPTTIPIEVVSPPPVEVESLDSILSRMNQKRPAGDEIKQQYKFIPKQGYDDEAEEYLAKSAEDADLTFSPEYSIPSPETEKPGYDWSGSIKMEGIAEFEGTASQILGPLLSNKQFEAVLAPNIIIEGRIPSSAVVKYITQQLELGKDLLVMEVKSNALPSSAETVAVNENQSFTSLFEYFHTRDRFGVVPQHFVSVKDMYIVPMAPGDTVHPFLSEAGFTARSYRCLLCVILLVKGFSVRKGKGGLDASARKMSHKVNSAPADQGMVGDSMNMVDKLAREAESATVSPVSAATKPAEIVPSAPVVPVTPFLPPGADVFLLKPPSQPPVSTTPHLPSSVSARISGHHGQIGGGLSPAMTHQPHLPASIARGSRYGGSSAEHQRPVSDPRRPAPYPAPSSFSGHYGSGPYPHPPTPQNGGYSAQPYNQRPAGYPMPQVQIPSGYGAYTSNMGRATYPVPGVPPSTYPMSTPTMATPAPNLSTLLAQLHQQPSTTGTTSALDPVALSKLLSDVQKSTGGGVGGKPF